MQKHNLCTSPNKKFDIDKEYIEDCEQTYQTLLHLPNIRVYLPYHPQYFVGLIAEYAATYKIECIGECSISFGFIECFKDFDYSSSFARACLDINDNIRYFLNKEPDSEYYDDENYENNFNVNEIEIICEKCCIEWKCTQCNYQALEYDHYDNICECIVCKQSICVDCALSLLDYCIDSKYKIYHTICQNCYDNDDINDNIIKQSIDNIDNIKKKQCIYQI